MKVLFCGIIYKPNKYLHFTYRYPNDRFICKMKYPEKISHIKPLFAVFVKRFALHEVINVTENLIKSNFHFVYGSTQIFYGQETMCLEILSVQSLSVSAISIFSFIDRINIIHFPLAKGNIFWYVPSAIYNWTLDQRLLCTYGREMLDTRSISSSNHICILLECFISW